METAVFWLIRWKEVLEMVMVSLQNTPFKCDSFIIVFSFFFFSLKYFWFLR